MYFILVTSDAYGKYSYQTLPTDFREKRTHNFLPVAKIQRQKNKVCMPNQRRNISTTNPQTFHPPSIADTQE
jgi:hypothetical protein